MKFFNIDQHASVIADVANIFNNLGHEVDDWSISGHHWVMNKPKANVNLNNGTRIISSGVCTQDCCDMFYETHKDELDKYDAFIACYPAEFSLLYEKWNKPIIIVNCVRYEYPNSFTPSGEIIKNRLNEFLKRRHSEGKIYYVCNNKGDQFYTHYFTGIWGMHIPSLCEYTNAKYTGTKNKYVLQDRSVNVGINNNLFVELNAIKNDKWRHSWADLYSHKGIIHVPYHNSSISIFEQYTANVPLFFPSKTYAIELFRQNKIFDDLTIYKIQKVKEPDDMNNPNSLRNPEILNKWIDTCDFYDCENLKHIQYFDSPNHLEHLLRTVDTKEISRNMAAYNVLRKESIFARWKEILTSIESQL